VICVYSVYKVIKKQVIKKLIRDQVIKKLIRDLLYSFDFSCLV